MKTYRESVQKRRIRRFIIFNLILFLLLLLYLFISGQVSCIGTDATIVCYETYIFINMFGHSFVLFTYV